MDVEKIRKLVLLEIQNNGMPTAVYAQLTAQEKKCVEKKDARHFVKQSCRQKIRVVLTGGVFDILHAGHIVTLSEAKKLGDILITVLARDELIERTKKRTPIHSQEYRAMMVNALKPVDFALVGFKNPADMLKRVKPDVIVYGYDQHVFLEPPGVVVVKLKKHLEKNKFKTNKIIKELGI
ncbi:MAG: adenylyltransferase/cytidyltransferase family protein [Candidatus Micrarchaeota archaeon]